MEMVIRKSGQSTNSTGPISSNYFQFARICRLMHYELIRQMEQRTEKGGRKGEERRGRKRDGLWHENALNLVIF